MAPVALPLLLACQAQAPDAGASQTGFDTDDTPVPWRSSEDTWESAVFTALGPAGAEPVHGVDLLLDGGFEGSFGPSWVVTEGSCDRADGVEGSPSPYAGSASWFGGQDACVAAQTVDLVERGFSMAELDGGELSFHLQGWLRNGSPPGDFESRDWDDQVELVVEWKDIEGEVLARSSTLGAGDEVWILREVQGLVPRGTRSARVSVRGTWRAGEVHDSLADELGLRLEPRGPSMTTLTKGPMLTQARSDGTVVLWETDSPYAESHLWVADDTAGTQELAGPVTTTQVDDDRFVHVAEITGLSPDSPAVYQVQSGDTRSESFEFRTLPDPGEPLRIGWFADNQLGPDQLTTHLDLMRPEDPDLLVAVGDIVQEGWRLADWDQLWFEPLDASGLTATRPVLVVRGNHDGEYPEAYAYTDLPGNGAWYSVTLGALFLIVLDSEAPTDGEQLLFLEERLASEAAREASFVAVTFHRTAWSNTRDLAWGHHLDEARTDWQPVFEAHQVDLVICGHHHSYQRGTQDGVTYLVVGGAGNFLDGGHWDQFDFIEVEEIVHHHGMLDVSAETLTWTAVLEDGEVLDRFVLEKRD